MNIWHDINPSAVSPESFSAVIEIPKGSRTKYELDKSTGLMRLDRILYTSTHYPANYGFIPRTYGDDGDPLDVLLICNQALEPMSLVRAYPIGVITMIDNGRFDEKIIAIPFNDPNYNQYKSIDELPKHIFDEMAHFFKVYKNLENKDTAVNEVQGRDEAIKIINSAIDHYIDSFCK
jgi:inorganic pyrophosphatase